MRKRIDSGQVKVSQGTEEIEMSDSNRHFANLPPEQEAIRAKCFHPTGMFVGLVDVWSAAAQQRERFAQ